MGIESSTNGGDVEMQDGAEEQSLPSDVIAEIEEVSQTLSATRRKRKPPPEYPTAAQLGTYTDKTTIPSLHASSPAGINSLALSKTQPSLFLTGGNDKIVQLYDRDAGKVAATLKGHTKKVNIVAFREKEGDPTLILSGSADKTARIWEHDATSGEYAPKQTIKTHKGEITGLAVHPTRTLLALASADRTYSIHSLTTFQQIFQSGVADDAYTSVSTHPDGTLLALGTPNSTVQIFDIRTGKIGATLTPTTVNAPFTVNTLSFSENGYFFGAPGSNSTVAIWDLRHQREVHTINLGEKAKVNKITFDNGPAFLGVASSLGATAYAHKTWDEVIKLSVDEDVNELEFSADGKEVWGVVGREVKIWTA